MEQAPYDHRFHVGNHGDVWKHTAWLAALAAFKREQLAVVDTHAGRGEYVLPQKGEWTAGIGRLRRKHGSASTGSGAVDRYLARVPDGQRYLGSPLLTRAALGRNDRFVAYEADEGAAAALREAVKGDARVRVVHGDGWAAPELDAAGDVRTLVLVDPPFHDKQDWTRVPELCERAHRSGHAVMAWYPIKRWTRPVALQDALRARGVPHVALDLLFTPVEKTGHVMAGSGLVAIGLPASVITELLGATAVLGTALATTEGRWSCRAAAFGT